MLDTVRASAHDTGMNNTAAAPLTAAGDFRRYGSVTLSDGRTGVVVGYDSSTILKVRVDMPGGVERPIVKAERAS